MMLPFSRALAFAAFLVLPSGQGAAGPNLFAQAEKVPPYEERLLRLSEIIGSLHFLTLLCHPEQGQVWHDKMVQLLDAEATTLLRRAKLIERFNSGFSGFQTSYRTCTPSATTALERYVGEAQVIVQNLTSDFSG